MKMKELGPIGGVHRARPLDPPMNIVPILLYLCCVFYATVMFSVEGGVWLALNDVNNDPTYTNYQGPGKAEKIPVYAPFSKTEDSASGQCIWVWPGPYGLVFRSDRCSIQDTYQFAK